MCSVGERSGKIKNLAYLNYLGTGTLKIQRVSLNGYAGWGRGGRSGSDMGVQEWKLRWK